MTFVDFADLLLQTESAFDDLLLDRFQYYRVSNTVRYVRSV